jgi:hypothetical protein
MCERLQSWEVLSKICFKTYVNFSLISFVVYMSVISLIRGTNLTVFNMLLSEVKYVKLCFLGSSFPWSTLGLSNYLCVCFFNKRFLADCRNQCTWKNLLFSVSLPFYSISWSSNNP